jgi:hypothetical protein
MIAAIFTTAASITAAFLDAALLDEKAIFPSSWQRFLNNGREPPKMILHHRWRSVLDRLILSLADQQLPTGLAIIITGFAKNLDFHGSHFHLIA